MAKAKLKRQDEMDEAAPLNRPMVRVQEDFERKTNRKRRRRFLLFLAVLAWLVLLFGRSLVRQAKILDQVYQNANKQRKINELKMSNSQLQELIYERTDLQAIEEAAIKMGMIPSHQASRILIPRAKNDEIMLRLESADAEPMTPWSNNEHYDSYYNLEEYYSIKEQQELVPDFRKSSQETSNSEGTSDNTQGQDASSSANETAQGDQPSEQQAGQAGDRTEGDQLASDQMTDNQNTEDQAIDNQNAENQVAEDQMDQQGIPENQAEQDAMNEMEVEGAEDYEEANES